MCADLLSQLYVSSGMAHYRAQGGSSAVPTNKLIPAHAITDFERPTRALSESRLASMEFQRPLSFGLPFHAPELGLTWNLRVRLNILYFGPNITVREARDRLTAVRPCRPSAVKTACYSPGPDWRRHCSHRNPRSSSNGRWPQS